MKDAAKETKMVQARSKETGEGALARMEARARRRQSSSRSVIVDRTDPSLWRSNTSDTPETKGTNSPKPKEEQPDEMKVHQLCPVCESTVCSIRCKLVCPNCHSIVQGCCD